MVAVAGASHEAQLFNMILAIWSGPWALEMLMPWRSFSTPSTVTRSGGMGSLAIISVSER